MVSSGFDERAGACSSSMARSVEASVSLLEAVSGPGPVRERVDWLSVVEALDEVVLLLNSRHVVTYASPAVTDRLGRAPDALAGSSLGDLVHPDDLRGALRSVAQVGIGGPVQPTMRVRRADGEYVQLEWSLTRTGNDQLGGGEVLVLVGRDGTARYSLEDRLASADQRSRALLCALTEAVVFLDGQLRVEEVNDRAASLLGMPPHDLLGHRWFEVFDVEDESGRPPAAEQAFAVSPLTQPTGHGVRRSIRRIDGQRVHVLCRWMPLPGAASGQRGYVLTMQEAVGSPGLGVGLPSQRPQARRAAGLTPREHEVLERLADGQDAMKIARLLGLSVYSVRGHIKSLIRKLGVHSQLQAVVVAARRGIVDVAGDGQA
jgi:PAS domain S-box-containing protein